MNRKRRMNKGSKGRIQGTTKRVRTRLSNHSSVRDNEKRCQLQKAPSSDIDVRQSGILYTEEIYVLQNEVQAPNLCHGPDSSSAGQWPEGMEEEVDLEIIAGQGKDFLEQLHEPDRHVESINNLDVSEELLRKVHADLLKIGIGDLKTDAAQKFPAGSSIEGEVPAKKGVRTKLFNALPTDTVPSVQDESTKLGSYNNTDCSSGMKTVRCRKVADLLLRFHEELTAIQTENLESERLESRSSLTADSTEENEHTLLGKKGEKGLKGLRNISMEVRSKLETKRITTYDEVADELITELLDPGPNEDMSCTQRIADEKNIRRRVYDTINVLQALGMISRNRNKVQWKGPCANTDSDRNIANLKEERSRLSHTFRNKKETLQKMEEQMIQFCKLMDRNQTTYDKEGCMPKGMTIPFTLATIPSNVKFNIDITEDHQLVRLDSTSNSICLHDEACILRAISLSDEVQSSLLDFDM